MTSTTMLAPLPFEDHIGAWVPHGRFSQSPSASGQLDGLSFAVKDVFDVAGIATGAGNPSWLTTHPIPEKHSTLVAQLLAAGATLHGKTITDELAYSIHGDNAHYGMPINSAAPERIPGGSSSGSVAAVAAHLVDFALGTDTGGSTRVPASYCGVWGIRTTHDLLSREGLVALHPRFDTATFFAHTASTFERVGQTLLPASSFCPNRAYELRDACLLADEDFSPALQAVKNIIARLYGTPQAINIATPNTLEDWRQNYVTAGAFEGWQTHGAWIVRHAPEFSPAIAARWQQASRITPEQAAVAFEQGQGIRAHIRNLLGNNAIAILPSAASVAPLRQTNGAEIDAIRLRTLRICCIAGLAGLPQVSIPFQTTEGIPIGISIIGPAGSDLALIRIAQHVHGALQT